MGKWQGYAHRQKFPPVAITGRNASLSSQTKQFCFNILASKQTCRGMYSSFLLAFVLLCVIEKCTKRNSWSADAVCTEHCFFAR